MLIMLLFLMGTQSALFSPLKYSILPQHLKERELTGGNGLLSMGTFLAILLGTILGGILILIEPLGPFMIASIVVILAILGYWSSRGIPNAEATAPNITINWNIASQTFKIIQYARENRSVFIAILAICWFWFVGATYLAQVPAYSKNILGSNNQVVTLLLTMFSVGIGLGSLLCEKMSKGRIELGLVPFGSLGLILFSLDIYFASQPFVTLVLPAGQLGYMQFLAISGSWRVLVDLMLIGLFGGFYVVPLNALVQHRCNPQYRAQVIAANNILNALVMVISALATIGALQAGFTIPEIFLSLGILSIVVTSILFMALPEFMERLTVWLHFKEERQAKN